MIIGLRSLLPNADLKIDWTFEANNFWLSDGAEKPQICLEFSLYQLFKNCARLFCAGIRSKFIDIFIDSSEIFPSCFEVLENRKMLVSFKRLRFFLKSSMYQFSKRVIGFSVPSFNQKLFGLSPNPTMFFSHKMAEIGQNLRGRHVASASLLWSRHRPSFLNLEFTWDSDFEVGSSLSF